MIIPAIRLSCATSTVVTDHPPDQPTAGAVHVNG
jgi:hypothetical protein